MKLFTLLFLSILVTNVSFANKPIINDSIKNIHNSTVNVFVLKDIEKNKELKKAVRTFFGDDYKSIIKAINSQSKRYEELHEYLMKVLEGKNTLEETLSILNKEIKKKNKRIAELEQFESETEDRALQLIIEDAKVALDKFNFKEYHRLLENYRKTSKDKKAVERFARSYFLQGEEYFDRFKYSKAVDKYKSAFYTNKISLYAIDLGTAYHQQGNLTKSIEYFEKALEIDLKTVGKDHSNVARDYNNLGLSYKTQGNLPKAIEYYEKALEIDLKNFGENNSKVATSYNNLGLAYKAQGNLAKAIEYFNKALEIDLKNFGENNPRIATYNNNLGTTYHVKGNLPKAIEYYEKVLKILEKTVGEKHPYFASTLNNLGLAYQYQENFTKAIEYYEKALEIDLKTLGKDNPNTAIDYNNLGLAYQDQGNLPKAIEYLEKSYNIFISTYGENNPSTQTVLENLNLAKAEL